MKAIIDTLQSKGPNGEPVNVYPRTLIECITNKNGDKLEDTIKEFVSEEIPNIDGNIYCNLDEAEESEDIIQAQHTSANGLIAEDFVTKEDLHAKEIELKEYTDNKVDGLIYEAPEIMDTFKEVHEAFKENEDVITALNECIGTRAKQSDLDDIINGIIPVGNSLKLNGLKVEEFVSNENLVINSNFDIIDLTNQPIKMWENQGDDDLVITKETDGIVLTNNGSEIKYFVYKITENAEYLYDKTVTLSVKVNDDTILSSTGIVPTTTPDTAATIYRDEGDIYVYRNTDTLQVSVGVSPNTSYKLNWVKLELGSVATPYIPPNKEVEKLKCGFNIEAFNKQVTPTSSGYATLLEYIFSLRDKGVNKSTFFASEFPDLPVDNWGFTVEMTFSGTIYVEIEQHLSGGVKYIREIGANNEWISNWRKMNDGGNAKTINGVTIYGNMSSFGINQGVINQVTLDDIYNAIPNNSILQCIICKNHFPNIGIPSWAGLYLNLFIYKYYSTQGYIKLTDNINGREWCSARHETEFCSAWNESYLPLNNNAGQTSVVSSFNHKPIAVNTTNENADNIVIDFQNSGISLGALGIDKIKGAIYKAIDNTVNTILHTGNKPSGNYSGNGNNETRTINIGGIGTTLKISSGNSLAFIDSNGGVSFHFTNKTTTYFGGDEIKFVNGVLTISTDNGNINANGSTYGYQVL